MIITCNSCNSRFNIDERLIKPQGSKVKCSKCQTVFVVHPPQKEEEKPLIPEVAPLLDDEDSGVDIEKDFVKSERPAAKPVFEEPDVVGGSVEPPPEKPAAPQARVPRRVPARSAGGAASGVQRPDRPERPVRPERSERPERHEPLLEPEDTPERSERPERPERAERRSSRRPPSAAQQGAGSVKRMPPPPPMPEETLTDEEAFIDDAPPPAKTGKGKGKGKDKGGKKPPKEGKRSGGLVIKLLILIVIIIILLLAAAFALPKFGIDVPGLNKLNIIGQFMNGGASDGDNDPTPQLPNRDDQPITLPDRTADNDNTERPGPSIPIQDTNGILHFYMDPELVNSGILGNTSAGIVIIVEGLLQNNYSDPRKAVKIVGRLYNERYELEQEKIVYAGNLLTEEDLVTLNPLEIENRLYTNGREATVQANSTIPFMIVFSNIPEPISNYTYECELVSSESADVAPAPISMEPAP